MEKYSRRGVIGVWTKIGTVHIHFQRGNYFISLCQFQISILYNSKETYSAELTSDWKIWSLIVEAKVYVKFSWIISLTIFFHKKAIQWIQDSCSLWAMLKQINKKNKCLVRNKRRFVTCKVLPWQVIIETKSNGKLAKLYLIFF